MLSEKRNIKAEKQKRLLNKMPVEQLFETERDLIIETNIIKRVSERWHCEYEKMPQSYAIDFALKRHYGGKSKLWAFAEIRTKNHKFGDFPDVFCNLKKLNQANQFRDEGFDTFFIVKWECGTIGFTRLNNPDKVEMGGRATENCRNPEDREPLGHWMVQRFEEIMF